MINKCSINSTKYHGSGYNFNEINLSKCKGYRDFGRGFYLSERREHALSMAKRGLMKTGEGYIYHYRVPSSFPLGVNVKYFKSASIEWLDFIIENRSLKYHKHKYDVVIGPTCDAAVTNLIDKYESGEFGEVGNIEAKQRLIKELKTHVFPFQTCVCTKRGVECITRINKEKIY